MNAAELRAVEPDHRLAVMTTSVSVTRLCCNWEAGIMRYPHAASYCQVPGNCCAACMMKGFCFLIIDQVR